MKHILYIASLLFALTTQRAVAQIVDGRTDDITLFPTYQSAYIALSSGKVIRHNQANIFLKNSSLIYNSMGKVMQANMDVVKSVTFGDRHFMKIGSKLAEITDSCGNNLLVLIREINKEGLNMEILNNSTITNISTGANQLGITRVDSSPDQLSYPVDEVYYFVVDGKNIVVDEREVRRAFGRKRIDAYDRITKQYGFRWSDKSCLLQILKALSEPK